MFCLDSTIGFIESEISPLFHLSPPHLNDKGNDKGARNQIFLIPRASTRHSGFPNFSYFFFFLRSTRRAAFITTIKAVAGAAFTTLIYIKIDTHTGCCSAFGAFSKFGRHVLSPLVWVVSYPLPAISYNL